MSRTLIWIFSESDLGSSEERESIGLLQALKEKGWRTELALLTRSARPLPARELAQRFGVFEAHLLRGPDFKVHLEFLSSKKSGQVILLCDGLEAATFSSLERNWIYRARMRESALWAKASRELRNPWERALAWIKAQRIVRDEKRVLSRASLVMTKSLEDFRALKRLVPQFRGGVAHSGITVPKDIPAFAKGAGRNLRLAFSGHLDWPPNQEGIEWFLTRLWPSYKQSRPQAELRIGGAGSPDWLMRRLPLEGVSYWGEIEDPRAFFEGTHLMIAPVFFGSGTRAAALEAAGYGRPVLSTALGIEGLGLEREIQYIHAETETEWLASLLAFDAEECQRVGSAAREFVKREYGWDKAVAEFESLISTLGGTLNEGSPRV